MKAIRCCRTPVACYCACKCLMPEPLTKQARANLEMERAQLIRNSAYATGEQRESVNARLFVIAGLLSLDDAKRACRW